VGGGGPWRELKKNFKNAATLLNKRPSYLISRGRNPQNPIKILNKCPPLLSLFCFKNNLCSVGSKLVKRLAIFFYFTAVSGNGFAQYTKTVNEDKNFSF